MRNDNFFSFDAYEIEMQSVSYNTLPASKSARKISGILVLFAGLTTLAWCIISEQITLVEIFIIPLLFVTGWFSYKGNRVALVCGIILWSFVKVRLFFLEFSLFHLLSLGVYQYYLFKALTVENCRRKVPIKSDFADFILFLKPKSKKNFFAGTLAICFIFGLAFYKFGDRFFDFQWNLKANQLSSYKIRKDISLLKYTLDNAYSGRHVRAKEYAVLINDLDSLLDQSHKGIDRETLQKNLQSFLQKMPDGHLSISLPNCEELQSRSVASIKNSDLKIQNFRINEFKIQNKTILNLAIPTFKVNENGTVDSMLTQLEEKVKKSDVLILDLRGNSGGRISTPLKIGAILWGAEYEEDRFIQTYPNPIRFASSVYNEVVYGLIGNWQKKMNSNSRLQHELEARYEIPSLPEMKFHIDNYTENETNTYDAFQPELKEKGFDKPIYIIVDEFCASACERMLESLEMHPHKLVIGQQTQGAVQFGSVGLLTLPNSEIDVVIPTSYVEYKDSRVVERVGYKPDVVLSSEIDPLQVAIQRIEKSISKK